MKRPKDFYLHHYWRDLSSWEKDLLDSIGEPTWLDSPVRGDWRDWAGSLDRYKRILDQETRKQLGEFVDWSRVKRDVGVFANELAYRFLIKIECQDWDRISWGRLAEKWKSLLKKEGYKHCLLYHLSPGSEDPYPLGVDVFGSKWNDEYATIENIFSIDFFPDDRLTKDELELTILLGPFYNAKALRLNDAIPKVIRTIRQIITEIQKETNKINDE